MELRRLKRCQAPGCDRERSGRAQWCEMHYYRLRRTGALELTIRIPASRLKTSAGYIMVWAPGHQLETRCGHGRVFEHRIVYHQHHGNGPFSCHWCGKRVVWSTMHVDHLDDDPKNNKIDNLVASCPRCNQKRGIPKMRATQNAQGRLLTANGETKSISAWSRDTGLSRAAIQFRLKKGWTPERAVVEPRGKFGPK